MNLAASRLARAHARRVCALSGLATVLMLCARGESRAVSRSPSGGASPTAVARATPVLPFISDDYAKALAVARAKKLPLFIEAWAPW